MKSSPTSLALLFAFFFLRAADIPASGQESAYQALRSLAGERGDAMYGKITSVQGSGGAPQPETWRVAVEDDLARGGIREYQIVRGRVASEKTPIRFPGSEGGGPINFSRLNLDSTGAFTLAEEEAVKAKTGFDSVDYNLGPDRVGNPVWTLRLLDGRGELAGLVAVGADDGRIVRREFGRGASDDPSDYRDEDAQFVGRPGDPGPAENPVENRYGGGYTVDGRKQPGFTGKLNRFGERVKRHFYRAGGVMEQFFTGDRTIDRDYRDLPEPDDNAPYAE